MKKIVRKIEEDYSRIGCLVDDDLIYPTQFIISASNLSMIGDNAWLEAETGDIFVRKVNNSQLQVENDGLIYQSVLEYDTPFFSTETNFFTAGVPQYNGKIAFQLVAVKQQTIEEGICVGEGMPSKEKYPNEQIVVVGNIYDYDGEAERLGLKCMTSETGKNVSEIFYATNWLASPTQINYAEEVRDYLLSQKTK